MSGTSARYLRGPVAEHLRRPLAIKQPILARKGKPTVDLERLSKSERVEVRVLVPRGLRGYPYAVTEPLVVEKFSDIPELGRFVLVRDKNIGAGIVLERLETIP